MTRLRLIEMAMGAALVGAALIHLLPLPGVLGGEWLVRLYAIALPDPNTELLLRHRALVFGLMGFALCAALWCPALRLPAIVFVLASDAAFLGLALLDWPAALALVRVAVFDVVSIALLVLAATATIRT